MSSRMIHSSRGDGPKACKTRARSNDDSTFDLRRASARGARALHRGDFELIRHSTLDIRRLTRAPKVEGRGSSDETCIQPDASTRECGRMYSCVRPLPFWLSFLAVA